MKNNVNMTPKPYNTEDQSMPVAAEPATVYRKMEGNDERIISTFHSHEANGNTAGRMSVDEYFDELWSMYLKKRENL